MIRKPDNWENVQAFSDRKTLPVGGYVCRIKQSAVQPVGDGQQLAVLFDIVEGDYAGFYEDDFRGNTRDDKKWKGVLRIWLPKYDGSEKDGWTLSSLKGFTTSVEKSNPGYTWNWDEQTLKGKLIGIIFRSEEWDYNGKHGWAVRPFRAASVEAIREGDFEIPADKPLKNSTFSDLGSGYGAGNPFAGSSAGYGRDDGDGELPF